MKLRAILPARKSQRQGLSAKRMNYPGGVDATSAGAFVGAENVGTILEHELVRRNVLVDGRIQGDSDDQVSIVQRWFLLGCASL